MKHTLFEKLLAFYLLFFSVGTILFFLIVPDKIEEHLLSGKTYSLTRAAEQLAEYPNVYHCSFSKKDAIQLKELLDSISVSCKLEIWLVNEDGRILMSTKQRYPLSHPLQIDQFEDVANDRSCWITGTFFGMFRQKVLSIIAPVTIAPHTTDFVIIHYPLSRIGDGGKYTDEYLLHYFIYYLYTLRTFAPCLLYSVLPSARENCSGFQRLHQRKSEIPADAQHRRRILGVADESSVYGKGDQQVRRIPEKICGEYFP